MSKAMSSPTARLLQTSRLFSLPKPLPAPPTSIPLKSGLHFNSDSATLPYPTHQAIDVPHASRTIGEWGLKRNLPQRTTVRSGTPIRVLAQDTNDHVTDFVSSGDYSVTLRKFQEMSIPLLRHTERFKSTSAYEDWLDVTDRQRAEPRWKITGPWLNGLKEHDVEVLLKRVQKQKPEWDEYLTEHFANKYFQQVKEEELKEFQYFGPLELQLLQVQLEYFNSDLERKMERARASGSNVEQKIDELQTQAQIRRAELEAQAQRLEAISRARDALQSATSRVAALREAVEFRQHEAAYTQDPDVDKYDFERDESEGEQRAAQIMREAYEDVFEQFEIGIEDIDESEHDSRSRQLIAEATASFVAEEQRRITQLADWEVDERRKHRPNKEALENETKRMRNEFVHQRLFSELTSLLVQFFDLPGLGDNKARLAQRNSAEKTSRGSYDLFNEILNESTSQAQSIPMTTHPGAGLGYLRTEAAMQNHPEHGPQWQSSPVLSRVVRPRNHARGHSNNARVSIGGFVVMDPRASTRSTRTVLKSNKSYDYQENEANLLDPYKVGGNKIWLNPQSATVTATGNPVLSALRPDQENVAVKTGEVDDILEQKKRALNISSPYLQQHNAIKQQLVPDRGRPLANYGIANVARSNAPKAFRDSGRLSSSSAVDELTNLQRTGARRS